MSDLILLLYLADVAKHVQSLLVASTLISAALLFGCFMTEASINFRAWTVGALICAVLASLIPSQRLLWVAAGMRAGVSIMDTPVAQKAMSLLEKRLDDALKETAK